MGSRRKSTTQRGGARAATVAKAETIHETSARKQKEQGLRAGGPRVTSGRTPGDHVDIVTPMRISAIRTLYPDEAKLEAHLNEYSAGALRGIAKQSGIQAGKTKAETIARLLGRESNGAKGTGKAASTKTPEERYQAKRAALQQEIAGHQAAIDRLRAEARAQGRISNAMETSGIAFNRMDAEAKLARLEAAHARAQGATPTAKAGQRMTLEQAHANLEAAMRSPDRAARLEAAKKLVQADAAAQRAAKAGSAKQELPPLVPIRRIEGYRADPFSPPDPHFLTRLYGSHQLDRALQDYTLAKLKETAAKVQAAHPNTKPRSKASKQAVIDYIVEYTPAE